MLARESYVALVGEQAAGFSDVSAEGYIDMLFVSPRFARRGVARELLTFVELRARALSARWLSSNVSITARPLFRAMGFQVVAEQHPVTGGVVMTNFRMTKVLAEDPRPPGSLQLSGDDGAYRRLPDHSSDRGQGLGSADTAR